MTCFVSTRQVCIGKHEEDQTEANGVELSDVKENNEQKNKLERREYMTRKEMTQNIKTNDSERRIN